MIWFKSFCVGLLSVIISVPIGFVVYGYYMSAKLREPTISIDIVNVSKGFIPRMFVLLVFLLGAFWEYRRLSHR